MSLEPQERQLTSEEIEQEINIARAAGHAASWVWNDQHNRWQAPVAEPADGLPYIWNEEQLEWEPLPGFPRG